MNNKKLKLTNLKVKSFITQLDNNKSLTIIAGNGGGPGDPDFSVKGKAGCKKQDPIGEKKNDDEPLWWRSLKTECSL